MKKYTLIEVLVWIAIICILVGICCGAFGFFKKLNSKGLKGVVDDVWYGSEGQR